MGNWFWLMILLGITVSLWEATGTMVTSIILADILSVIFYGSLPVIIYPTLFLLNIIAFASSLFFKPIAPQIQQ
jgi:hypothetical protein